MATWPSGTISARSTNGPCAFGRRPSTSLESPAARYSPNTGSTWTVYWTRSAQRGLDGLPAAIRTIALERAKRIEANPFDRTLPRWEKLRPTAENLYSVQVKGQYRILYAVDKSRRSIEIYHVGPHPSGRRYQNAMPFWVPNPSHPGTQRHVELITDRAKRYRARKAISQPERRCIYCGAPGARDVDHINGDEADNSPANLAWSCVSCNTAKGHLFARLGIGRRTRQFNPAKRARRTAGARTLAEWVTAVLSIKGQGPMPVQQAVELIRATPPEDRSAFAYEIWRIRRQRGTDRRVPF